LTGLREIWHDLAARYPAVQFIILQEDVRRGPLGIWESYIETFGLRAVPSSIRALLATDWPTAALPTLPSDGWADNVRLVAFAPGTEGDPGPIWEQTVPPDLMFFDGTGRFAGPYRSPSAAVWMARARMCARLSFGAWKQC